MKEVQLAIVGGGPAGLAAAVSAYDEGVRDILILERDSEPGGILNQCRTRRGCTGSASPAAY